VWWLGGCGSVFVCLGVLVGYEQKGESCVYGVSGGKHNARILSRRMNLTSCGHCTLTVGTKPMLVNERV